MSCADQITISSGEPGTSGYELMRRAGAAVWRVVQSHLLTTKRLVILIGPGNNGGDGLVVAALAQTAGLQPNCFSLTKKEQFRGDAALAASDYEGPLFDLSEYVPQPQDLIVDALFGAGLSKPIAGNVARLAQQINTFRRTGANAKVIAVDLPSGVNGETGYIQGHALIADETVTFFLKKPGHYLMPGRALCGQISCADIGIREKVLDKIKPNHILVDQAFAQTHLKPFDPTTHKYQRGDVISISGPEFRTGASRLAAMAALKVGAGLVTLSGTAAACREHASHVTSIMLDVQEEHGNFKEDGKPKTIIVGPAFRNTDDEACRQKIERVCEAGKSVVLDADALSLFEGLEERFFSCVRARPVILTPHLGEFRRLFPDATEDFAAHRISKVEAVRQAANRAGCTVLLKGPDTVVGSLDGICAINASGTPALATAGSGDVLAGLIGGLMAQGYTPFIAACLGAYIHGRAGEELGAGFVAEDLVASVPHMLAELLP